jgi:hypothetical protein
MTGRFAVERIRTVGDAFQMDGNGAGKGGKRAGIGKPDLDRETVSLGRLPYIISLNRKPGIHHLDLVKISTFSTV